MCSKLPMILAALLAAGAAGAQTPTPARGMLLVANEGLTDANFTSSVVLLLHYGDEGALGLIVNRPTWVTPGQVLPDKRGLASYKGHLYVGGPVAPVSLVALVRAPEADPDADEVGIVDDVYASSEPDSIERLAERARGEGELRLYSGHALWAPGQLEREIAAGGWRVVPGHADLIFSEDPENLWQRLNQAPAGEEQLTASRSAAPAASAPDAVRLLR